MLSSPLTYLHLTLEFTLPQLDCAYYRLALVAQAEQLSLCVSDEKNAMQWLRAQLDEDARQRIGCG